MLRGLLGCRSSESDRPKAISAEALSSVALVGVRIPSDGLACISVACLLPGLADSRPIAYIRSAMSMFSIRIPETA